MDEVDKTDKVENPVTDKAGVDKADGAYEANGAKDSDICIAEKDIPDRAEDPDTSTVSLDRADKVDRAENIDIDITGKDKVNKAKNTDTGIAGADVEEDQRKPPMDN